MIVIEGLGSIFALTTGTMATKAIINDATAAILLESPLSWKNIHKLIIPNKSKGRKIVTIDS